jgi:hypothetical protein
MLRRGLVFAAAGTTLGVAGYFAWKAYKDHRVAAGEEVGSLGSHAGVDSTARVGSVSSGTSSK